MKRELLARTGSPRDRHRGRAARCVPAAPLPPDQPRVGRVSANVRAKQFVLQLSRESLRLIGQLQTALAIEPGERAGGTQVCVCLQIGPAAAPRLASRLGELLNGADLASSPPRARAVRAARAATVSRRPDRDCQSGRPRASHGQASSRTRSPSLEEILCPLAEDTRRRRTAFECSDSPLSTSFSSRGRVCARRPDAVSDSGTGRICSSASGAAHCRRSPRARPRASCLSGCAGRPALALGHGAITDVAASRIDPGPSVA